ncbi:hypothetical protein VSDG_07361 [Cytospora chrysosperma]|uniref:Thioesterase domain-containing protein n=1 Tax=Cytospora chrysosperma TaxID=252740 RepID=A0A423VQ10_CYTCH|nr:hypothetical protein VSDG_07361 [Valsa sordida]
MILRPRLHTLRLGRGWTTAAPSTAPVPKFARPLSASSRLDKAPIAVSADASPGPPPQRWLSDLRARLGKCLVFGCSPAQVTEAGLVLRALADEWRGLLAGSEGFLTGGRRGLEGQQVVWGEQDSFQHVNNVRYIRWAESARVNWVTNFAVRVDPAHGREWAELMTPKAVGLILKSIKTDFKFPMTYPDKVSVYHKLRFPPSAQPSPSSLILDAVIFSHRHRRVAARIEEDIVIYDYRSAKKTEMLPFMRNVLEDTFRLQELEAARARTRIWDLISSVEKLEQETWNRAGAVEDHGTATKTGQP